jgi:replicative DNA helicase
MKLSAPIYILKQQAKSMSRRDKVRLHVALNQIAAREGFKAWAHLASVWQRQDSSRSAYDYLHNGDLLLVGARPGQGKTMLSAGLAIEAMTRGHRAAFFTLECTAAEVEKLVEAIGRKPSEFRGHWLLDTSEDISAQYIIRRLADAPPGTLVVVDYLQLLDQRRDKPSLDLQVRELSAFAQASQTIIVCLSQIGRDYTLVSKACPSMQDVRLPNPVDLSLFNKACFIHDGKMQLHTNPRAA